MIALIEIVLLVKGIDGLTTSLVIAVIAALAGYHMPKLFPKEPPSTTGTPPE